MNKNTGVTKFESLRGKSFTQISPNQLNTIRGGQAHMSDAMDAGGGGGGASCTCVSASGCGCTDCGDID
jgi:hypothetical protein